MFKARQPSPFNIAAVGFFFFLMGRTVAAHPQDMGLLESTVDGNRITFSLVLPLPAVARITGLPETEFTAADVASKASVLQFTTLGEAKLESSAGSCEWGSSTAALKGDRLIIATIATCPASPSSWRMKIPFLRRAPGGYEMWVKAQFGDKKNEIVVSAETEMVEVSSIVTQHSWWEFIQMGVAHIGALPSEWKGPDGFHLPDGIDHILFVIALVLAGGGFLGVLKTVTGFTIGHSITLALATLGWVHLPQRLVESAIALSIAFVAAEAFFLKSAKSRWRIALIFGLVHGLGFASALAELHLDRASVLRALVGFNVGVELGQAIIVAITLPILQALQTQRWTRKFAVPTCAAFIFVAGSYWFVRRAFGI